MMRTPSLKSLMSLPALAGVLFATACTASGGGTLVPSSSLPCTPGPTAAGAPIQGSPLAPTFGFNATAATTPFGLPQATFNGTYSDACAGVRLIGTGTLNPVAPPPQAPPTVGGCLGGVANYTSQNPQRPGTGTFLLVTCDAANQFGSGTGLQGSGQSPNGDFLLISVFDGPYAGYGIFGAVQNGNIVVQNGVPLTH